MSVSAENTLPNDKKLKIGIIGSGISGASNAYFLKQIFGDNVEIVIFEKNGSTGGRLATFEFNDRPYEYGGTLIHPSNKYMEEFLKMFGLEKKEKDDKTKLSLCIFDKSGILLKTTGKFFGLIDNFVFLKYFGFSQLINFRKWIRSFIKEFSKIYRLQDNGFVFNTLEEFLTKLNPKLYKLSQQSLVKALEEKKI